MLRSFFVLVCLLAWNLSAPAPAVAADQTHEMIDDLGYQPGPNVGKKLLPYLKSNDAQHRWRAARALGNLRYQPAAGALAELLGDEDPVVQVHAIIALGRIDDDSSETIDAIMRKVASEDARVARAAIAALRKLEPGPEKLAAAIEHVLQSDDHAVMTHALEAMVDAGENAVPLLKKALKNEKSAYWAALAISEIGEGCAETAPALAELIAECKDPYTLQQAVLAVAALGDGGKAALDAVKQVANDTDEDGARIAACYALGAVGDASATDLLKRLASEGGEFQKMVCAWSLSKLHPNDFQAQRHAVELLTKALMSERSEVREAAAQGLSKLDAPSEVVAPALLTTLKGADDEHRAYIAAALASIGPDALEKAIPALQKPEFRDIAIEVIGRLGPDAARAAAPLGALLPTTTEEQQARINFALAAIGPSANEQGAAVVAGLKSSDAAVRQSALFALRKLGRQKTEVVHEIAEFYMDSSDDFEKLAAAWAVASMAPKGEVLEAVVKALGPGLDHSDAKARYETVLAIRDLGAGGKPFLSKLRILASADPDVDVREAAGDVAAGM